MFHYLMSELVDVHLHFTCPGEANQKSRLLYSPWAFHIYVHNRVLY